MDDGSRLSWMIIVVLFCFAAYFGVAETAFASVSTIKIRTAVERGDSRAEKAMFVLENFDRAVTTILIGTNIVHLVIASMVTVQVTRRWGLSAVTVGTLVTTIAVFFLGEMLPKSIAKRYSERLALATAGSLCFFMRLFSPISWILTRIGQAAAKLSGSEGEVSVTEDELYDIIEDMTDGGALDETQGELISSALEFGDITVDSILTSRVDLEAIDVTDSPEEIVAYLKAHRHSRYPVYEETTDHIIGTVQLRKYLREYRKNKNPDLRALLDEPFFIHYSMPVADLIGDISEKKLSMAIVLDDFGGTRGIVTVEDVLEELVGEIWDEEDIVAESFTDMGHGRFLASADMTVGEIFERMDYEPEEENEDLEYKRASEWAFEQFGHVPRVGENFTYEGMTVSVARMRQNRIRQLGLELPAGTVEGGEQA